MDVDANERATIESDLLVAPLMATGGAAPGSHRRRKRYGDPAYHWASLVVSFSLVVVLVAILAVLLDTAWPALTKLGVGFLTGTIWNPYATLFGSLPFIAGTLLTTGIALLIAIPIAIAIAILLSEYAPRPIATALGIVVDVAAGVPTIVFGAWAAIALVPWMRATFDPIISTVFGWVPYIGHPTVQEGGFSNGDNVLTACLVLAAMVFPTATVIIRNVFLATPTDMREASLGMGATNWETATRVVMRQGRAGILGGVVLACGRALGETIAIAFVIGGAPFIPRSLFDQGATLSTQLFSQVYGGGVIPGTLTTAALYELGVILLALSLLAGLGGQFLTRRLAGAALPGGGGR